MNSGGISWGERLRGGEVCAVSFGEAHGLDLYGVPGVHCEDGLEGSVVVTPVDGAGGGFELVQHGG